MIKLVSFSSNSMEESLNLDNLCCLSFVFERVRFVKSRFLWREMKRVIVWLSIVWKNEFGWIRRYLWMGGEYFCKNKLQKNPLGGYFDSWECILQFFFLQETPTASRWTGFLPKKKKNCGLPFLLWMATAPRARGRSMNWDEEKGQNYMQFF